MKGLICIAAMLCLMIIADSAFARGGSTRANLNMKWRKIEAWQKRQDQQFKKMERDAERSFRQMRGDDGPIDSNPYPGRRTRP